MSRSAIIERLQQENRELKSRESTWTKREEEWAKEKEKLELEIQKLCESNESLQSQVNSYLNRSARRGFASMLEHDSEVPVPGKIDFDDDSSVLTNAQRKHRRRTQFISKPVHQPSGVELQKRLVDTEKALEEEERIRSESELEVNKLHQVIAERDDRIRELEHMEKEKNKQINNYKEKIAEMVEKVADQKQEY
uniref:Uncharacterized protein n=1 Tax=Panagrolaimus superbus TaxID=310955 RepID=A0A914Z0C8_9BILA